MECNSKFCTKLVTGVIAGNARCDSLQGVMISPEAARAAKRDKTLYSLVDSARLHSSDCHVKTGHPTRKARTKAVCAELIARWGAVAESPGDSNREIAVPSFAAFPHLLSRYW